MRVSTLTARTVTVAALIGLATSGSVSVLTASGAQAAACADVDVSFARGTGEGAGLGITGTPFVNSLKSALAGKTVNSYAVNYAAAYDQSSAGPGATDMTNHVSSVAAACPNTTFVIGGYSQGASVTDIAIGIQSGGTAIPANLSGRVAAVVVFGNPLGTRGRTIATASPTYGPKSKDYCNAGDPVCASGGSNFAAHLAYGSNGSAAAGGQFAAGMVKAAAPGGTTPPTTAPTTPPTPPVTPPTTSPTTPPITSPGTPPGTPVGTCVTATNSKHISDGRANNIFGFAFAKGSGTFLGMASPLMKSSLSQTAVGSWKRVASC